MMLTTRQVADELVTLCRQGKNEEAMKKLYSPEIVSMEAADSPDGGFKREEHGVEQCLRKGEWWMQTFEVHDAGVRGPFMHGDDRFAVLFDFDTTHKPSGQRMKQEEVAVYTVKAGKIVREEFYYTMDM